MLGILYIMWLWYFGNKRREHYEKESEYVSLLDYRDQLSKLSADNTIPLFTTNLVYMTKIKGDYQIKRSTMYFILGPDNLKELKFIGLLQSMKPMHLMKVIIQLIYLRRIMLLTFNFT